MKGKDKMIAARTQLLLKHCFFGSLAMSLKLIESDQVPTMGTDGTNLLYNPAFSDKLSKSEILFVVCHEVMHLVFLTHLRMGNKDPKVWNASTDHSINLVLEKESGITMPEGGLIDKKYEEWSSEKIYQHLIQNPDEQPNTGDDGWNMGEVMPAGSTGEDGEPGSGQPMTKSKVEAEISKMKSKIQAAAISAKQAGQMSAGMDRLVNDICAPKADWREILHRFVSEKAFNDWNYQRCHTRIMHSYGIISPVLDGDTLGHLALIVDTSGSVDEKQLAQFAGEISDILENYDCKVTVVYIDTAINRIEEFRQEDLPLRLRAVGGGGTCAYKGYQHIREELEEVAAIVHYTDTWVFDWDKIEQPEVPVLVGCTIDRPNEHTPDWCEIIDISD